MPYRIRLAIPSDVCLFTSASLDHVHAAVKAAVQAAYPDADVTVTNHLIGCIGYAVLVDYATGGEYDRTTDEVRDAVLVIADAAIAGVWDQHPLPESAR